MKHKDQLNPIERSKVESIFEALNRALPTPPEIAQEAFRNSVSWFKKDSPRFESYASQMKRAAQVLRDMGHEVLVLETSQLQEILYEDSDQIVVKAGFSKFQILPANS